MLASELVIKLQEAIIKEGDNSHFTQALKVAIETLETYSAIHCTLNKSIDPKSPNIAHRAIAEIEKILSET